MNRRQRIAAQVGGGLLLLALFFPPMYRPATRETRPGFLYGGKDIVITTYGYPYTYKHRLEWTVLGLELAIIMVSTGLVFISVKDKE